MFSTRLAAPAELERRASQKRLALAHARVVEELQKLWVRHFCDVDFETLIEYSQRILDLGRYTITIRKG